MKQESNTLKVLCEISIGELIDKIAILRIKSRRVRDPIHLRSIRYEIKHLEEVLASLNLNKTETNRFLEKLIKVNKTIWRYCEKVHHHQNGKHIRAGFEALKTNDIRYEIKRQINARYGSSVQEIKVFKNGEAKRVRDLKTKSSPR